MPTVLVAGERLHYQIHGERASALPPLLLVHGATGNLMHWPGQLRRLAGGPVLALDLPGHGRSEGRGRQRIADYVDVVRSFAEALQILPYVFCGHSMGGAIGIELASQPGCGLAGLILVATGARLRVAPQLLASLSADAAAAGERLSSMAYQGPIEPDLGDVLRRRWQQVDPAVALGDFLACDGFDRMNDLAAITAPALVLCGAADLLAPPKFSRYLAEHIPGALLSVVPGAGHMVMLEQPDVVAQAVAGFLAGLTGPGRSRPPVAP